MELFFDQELRPLAIKIINEKNATLKLLKRATFWLICFFLAFDSRELLQCQHECLGSFSAVTLSLHGQVKLFGQGQTG